MEATLKETYGVTVYQEQVMRISMEMANFTHGEADSLRKAMSKKSLDLLMQFQEKFIKGSINNGVPENVAAKIWNDWLDFAQYAFNKSHATCYALVAYRTAWLKAHYPVEFMAALLSLEDDPAKIPVKIEVCNSIGIKILPPNINRSEKEFSVHGKEILFGLKAIKNLGEAAISALIEERQKNGPFTSIYNFCARLDSTAVNKTVLESLIASGAMDELEGTRAQKWEVIEQALSYNTGAQKDKRVGQTSLFDLITEDDEAEDYPHLPEVEKWSYSYQLEKEKEVLGFYLGGHPLYEYRYLIQYLSNANAKTTKELESKNLRLVGIITSINKKRDNKGNLYAFIEFEDLSGPFEVALFNKDFETFYPILSPGKIYFISGTRSGYTGNDESLLRINPQKIVPLEDWNNILKGELRLNVPLEKLSDRFLDDFTKILNSSKGNFSLKTIIHTDDGDNFKLEAAKNIFPSNALLELLKNNKLDFDLRLYEDDKSG